MELDRRGDHARRTRLGRWTFNALAAGIGIVFLGAVAHHVYWLDFRPLAAWCLPVLIVFFAFASLLYSRGKALAKGRGQIRSLYAAERAMQAAVWHFFGIASGAALYAVLGHFGAGGPWLLLFAIPFAFMQTALLSFMRAMWVISPLYLRRVGPFELRRRVEQA